MPRRTDRLAVVVACDDGGLRDRVAAELGAAGGIEVVAAIDTVRMVPSASRLKPDAVVLLSPRPRHVDLGRIGTLTRDRARRFVHVVLLVDDPGSIADRARSAGADAVGPVPADGDGSAELAAQLHRLRGPH